MGREIQLAQTEEFLDVDADADVSAYVDVDDGEAPVGEMVHLKPMEIAHYWHFQVVYFDLKKKLMSVLKSSQQSRSLMMLARPFRFCLKIYYPIHASTSQFDQLM